MKSSVYLLITLFLTSTLIFFTSCIDDSPLTAGDQEMGEARLASGPAYGNYYPYAEGIISAANETIGIFMENTETSGTLENATKLVSGDTYMGDAYMAMVQEDLFRFAQEKYEAQYTADPATAEKKYLKMASQIKVLLALYDEDVHLLVNTGSGINTVTDLAGKNVNLGSVNSGTYITAKTIMDAHGLAYTASYDDAALAVNNVIAGTYDAAFFVTAAPSSVFSNIGSGENVKLIKVQMPASKKIYSENGVILAGDYPFQTSDVQDNITVKTLLAAGPRFDNNNLTEFLDYMFAHADEYKSYNQNWADLAHNSSFDYMTQHPELCNYRAICYISGFNELDGFYIEPYFFSGYGISAYHDIAVELIWLLSHNLDVDLRERNSTGSWETSYRMLNGSGTMALVQDDIFSYLTGNGEMYDSMQVASMQKVAPLHYEYVHLLVNTDVTKWNAGYVIELGHLPLTLQEIFTDVADLNDAQPVLHINVGPKTSGTFITAMKIINSYKSYDGIDADTTPDMEEMEIHYYFDDPSDAVLKVAAGTYHAAFVVSGVPNHRFYSHDTWDIASDLLNTELIPARFYNADTPYPYSVGTLAGNGSAVFENYPYPNAILPADITTVRLRAVQVMSPAFNDNAIENYIKSIFRKTYYKVYPADPADLDFMPDPLWIAIQKESLLPYTGAVETGRADYNTYGEEVVGAKEYFVNNPFGWSKQAVKYYLSLFPDN